MDGEAVPDLPAEFLRLIVAAAPGGGTDFMARLVGQKLGEHLGLPKHPHRWRIAMARIEETEGDLDAAASLLDDAGRITGWNRGAERIMGFTAGEAVGAEYEALVPREETAAELRRATTDWKAGLEQTRCRARRASTR